MTEREIIIYKTRPKLILLSITLCGFAWFQLLSILIIKSVNTQFGVLSISFIICFETLSLTALYYFLTMRGIKLSGKTLCVYHLYLPMREEFTFEEIRSLHQTKEKVIINEGVLSKSGYNFYHITTIILLKNDKVIKLYSIGEMDFKELNQTFQRLRRGEGKIKVQKRHIFLYLLDNLHDVFMTIFFLFITIGLGYALLFG
ncbi:hypothetical protein [Flectobacillus roseus]|uniref:Uncharacterized protein n=1 Tax=Flectobacillus roseus TaxID=502259 RepID=A0ABT6Y3Y4_9BACT|nr:hypothetical protein [Flectobacillus roseus]MDI9858174.1 hypothetical protein [Flectobacillus roseus]